ncbi:hypothetical protein BJP36_37115 [Moorena producens JHB]|uniref:Uncharacterized protein n=1 Tax=Moorena producens (strain JHB) TaxID=1454205 RepID=A0A9Q9SU63_MOOP1|nr:hypothetical protein [Moorena producens]WAN69715.1 hypothetical protein BJP36_37115 [Moorena producens JHB]
MPPQLTGLLVFGVLSQVEKYKSTKANHGALPILTYGNRES